ncbi:MAG: hypothetical protein FWE48_06460 [Coriobacteriia bacterium]|nr:hypothetical protein [Coriobacteriia bacterium]
MRLTSKVVRLLVLLLVALLIAALISACSNLQEGSSAVDSEDPLESTAFDSSAQEEIYRPYPVKNSENLAPPVALTYELTFIETYPAHNYDPAFEVQDFVTPEWFTDYDSILEEYQKFADYSIEGGAENVFENNVFYLPENRGTLPYHWQCMIIEANLWLKRNFPATRDAFGYALKDLNGDGSPELVLLFDDYTVLAIFSMYEEKPWLVEAFWPRHNCTVLDSGLLFISGSGGADYTVNRVCQLSDDGSELWVMKEFGLDGSIGGYYYVEGGEKVLISRPVFERYLKNYPGLPVSNDEGIIENPSLEFIALLSEHCD